MIGVNNFSLIHVNMNNGLTYSLSVNRRSSEVIKYIEDHIDDDFVMIPDLAGAVLLNKKKIVGVSVKDVMTN
ncbi:hypothetical protein CBF85_10595 [Lactobacillus taiwanensis]|nr:hypothetical protein CBF51_09020 [Lactobacillus taiwanensis]OYS02504.1 hypothetical protein CBF61_02405 [Lactobacillus taiwanensis]OYS16223.1 hypothetical protein CBF69_02585 [Lactobacillus taiwanensis]OYS16288.1 hypothetical protein CBF69_02970 [Lactobacillus taiwanensis]OYS32356.1 hypothetical protein CBF85_10595 [Lactobacillus taiwanensis]